LTGVILLLLLLLLLVLPLLSLLLLLLRARKTWLAAVACRQHEHGRTLAGQCASLALPACLADHV
jgi:hypothetical protein